MEQLEFDFQYDLVHKEYEINELAKCISTINYRTYQDKYIFLGKQEMRLLKDKDFNKNKHGVKVVFKDPDFDLKLFGSVKNFMFLEVNKETFFYLA